MLTRIQNLPLVSVIMPVRNEGDAIRTSVAAVLSQDYPREHLEVLIVDGLSEDETPVRVCEMADQDSRIRLIQNKARLMAAGFNLGLSHARGEVIVMLGGHTEISNTYVSTCVANLKENKADCVGGVVEAVSKTTVGRAIALAMSSSFGVGGVGFRIGTAQEKYVDTVAFGAYSRDIINRAGLLDESFVRNQDDEYNYRIRELGARILLAPKISCRYYGRSSLGALWLQYFKYGYWKVRVMQKHPRQMRPRHFVPVLFVSALLLSLSLAVFSEIGLWLFGTIGSSYVAANVATSISLARKLNWRSLPFLPLAFGVLHISYGLGFLIGLISFWNRWSIGKDELHFSTAK